MVFSSVAHAASSIPLLDNIEANILNPLISLLFAVALLYFLYGVFELIKGREDPDAHDKGGQHILWGVIGMAIMVSAYGIIHIICGTFPDMGCR